ncbi:MAG TPA: sensor histidine kinase [Gemmatimonadaceae bacterium]
MSAVRPAAPPAATSRLAAFIRANTEAILAEWEAFARSLPSGETMDIAALRDHAKDMLLVIATDLDRPQSENAQAEKARGESDANTGGGATAAQEHGSGRAESGFTIAQMVAEFRALRASVTRLWHDQEPEVASACFDDMVRFNEAIDQAIAESVGRFSQAVTQTQERFLAILSHDLRTPLGAVLTATRFMLETGELAEPNRTLIQRVASSARRMNQMVLDLVEFTRTRLGDTIPVVRGEMDARRLAHDVVLEIGASYPGSRVQLETSGDLRGEWDGERLSQALTNLVANAVQHGAPHAPVKVSAAGRGDEIIIAIHNDGPPIPAGDRATIFDAGTRGGVAPRDRRHAGLGLYIVDRIVSAHGGTIDVQSAEDEGTTFTVRLPRRAAAPADRRASR